MLKQKLNSAVEIYRRKPKLIIPTVAILSLVLFGIFECVRAWQYENDVVSYKSSVKVLEMQQTVTDLQESVSARSVAAYCDLSVEGLLADFNSAYEPIVEEAKRPENLHKKLLEQAADISPTPAFSSLADFLPRPKKARAESERLKAAVAELIDLSTLDARSDYCLGLAKVLARTYFLSDLKKPEGVGALFVGQIENFQVNVSQAQEMMKTLKYPTDLEAEHIQVFEFLNTVAVDLRKDENKYTAFARNIEKDLSTLDGILQSIRDKTADMQKIPEKIALEAGYL